MSGYHYQISEASRLLAVEAHVLRYWEEELGMIIPRNEMGHRYYTEDHLRIFSQIKDMKERGYQLRAIRAILSGEEPPEPVITEIPLKKEERNEIRGEHLDAPGQATVNMPASETVQIPRTKNLPPAEMPAPSKEPFFPEKTEPVVEPKETYKESYKQVSVCGAGTASSGLEGQKSSFTERQALSSTENQEISSQKSQEERMRQFQAVMTHIVAQAMLCNNRGLARDISCQVEADLLTELQKMVNASENRQEERFRKLDETMRSIQQGNRARYEAAASRSPGGFFGRKRRKIKNRRI